MPRSSARADLRFNDQFELGRLQHRKVYRLLTLEQTGGIDAELAPSLCQIRPVAHQAARLRKFAKSGDGRNRVPRRQQDELIAPASQKRFSLQQEPADALFGNGCKSRVKLVIIADRQNLDLTSDAVRGRPHVPDFPLGRRSGIHQHRQRPRGGNQLVQQLQTFRRYDVAEQVHAGEITLRPVEAVHETGIDRIDSADE